jgi:predicted outer membrane repeat protein
MRICLPFYLFFTFLSASIINIPGDYSTIQAGIDASSNGDTVLVGQGTYYENLILEKEIVLASHAINDDLSEWIDNDNILQTIISGAQEPLNESYGSCLVIRDGDIEPTITGFTFRDGTGTAMKINNCGIDLSEKSGGAIVIYQAYPIISFNRFIDNGTSQAGGGNASDMIANGGAISHFDDEDVEFDEDRDASSSNLNSSRTVPATINVTNNYFENNSSGNGECFYSHGYDGEIDVSGSVFDNIDCDANDVNEFILHSIDEIADYLQNDISGNCIEGRTFYVSPSAGDNSNAGTDETEPLLTISHALSLVKRQSNNATVINLAAGIYSTDTNGESFPLVIPDKVHLIGDQSENTILNANANSNKESGVMIIPECENVRVANMTLKNGYSESHGCTGGGALLVTANDMENLSWDDISINNAEIENLIIEDSHSHNGGGLSVFRVDGVTVNNVIVRNNTATMMGGGINVYVANVNMSNVEIYDNYCIGTYYNGAQDVGHGGGLFMNQSTGTYDNMDIHDNTASMNGGGVWSSEASGWTMSNSNVSDNVAPYFGGGFGFWNHNGHSLNATLQNVTIENNVAQATWGTGHGGGVWANNCNTVFEDCSFIDNVSNNNGGAVNYWGGSSTPVFKNTLFDGNVSVNSGGAIYIAPDAQGFQVEYCTFINNSTTNGNGSAIQTNQPGTVINSTFYGNTAPVNSGTLGIGDYVFVDVYNSIFWNEDVSYEISGYASYSTLYHSLVQPMGDDGYDGLWNTWGFGNIDVDPLLTDPSEGDYTLSSESPCIDAGIADLDGDGVEDITVYTGSAPDMGAYEMSIAALDGFVLYPSDTYVVLTWNPTNEDGFQYYLLERSTDEEFTEENTVSNYLMSNYYEDNTLDYDTEYFYRVSFLASDWSELSDVISVTLEWLELDKNNLPTIYALHQNYPNPFNPVTNLDYNLPEDAVVNITIYDVMGNIVNTLANGPQSAGYKSLQWNATNTKGQMVSAGLYIYTIQAGQFRDTKKMILLK